MDNETFEVAKLKFDKELQEIEAEIAKLQQKKRIVIERIEAERKKLSNISRLFKENKVVSPHFLSHNYNPAVIKECDKELVILNQYLDVQNKEREKVKERTKLLFKIREDNLKEIKLKERKKEEEKLFEHHWFYDRGF